MTWRDKTIVAILLLVARILADDVLAAEIKSLANQISVSAPKVPDAPDN